MTGDYVTAITTSAAEVSDTAEFRVTVKTDTLWGLAASGSDCRCCSVAWICVP